ncbi:hypothetical protein PJ985_09245 [Streptomyces sp. ACA25]|uniref:hypothetical protein n=1 Tax=Streptomyces sp. ACA25 TaxID=3022596 RepID=UPI0023070337|nr:hypothetical protein [Streptomyces sp. ACA25]MDB1087750.1 hypothetical protein [Streptomyces sp. ACA25]
MNLGPAGSVPAPVRKAGNRPAVVTPMPVRERPKPCSQCCIGVAWDEQGRCRPCSTAGVMLGPAEPEPERPAPDDGAQGEPGDGWWGQLSRRKRKPRD